MNTKIFDVKSFMMEQFYLMKISLQVPNGSVNRNKNCRHIAVLKEQIEYLKEKNNEKEIICSLKNNYNEPNLIRHCNTDQNNHEF